MPALMFIVIKTHTYLLCIHTLTALLLFALSLIRTHDQTKRIFQMAGYSTSLTVTSQEMVAIAIGLGVCW